MAMQIFATVTGARQGAFKGESTQKGQEGKIPLVALTYGVTVPHSPAAGAGQASGKRQHGPVLFTKEWGASSPQFYTAAFTNEVLSTVLFEVFTAGPNGSQQLNHTIKLTNATLDLVDQHISVGNPAVDQRDLQDIAFVFEKIEITSVIGGTTAIDTV